MSELKPVAWKLTLPDDSETVITDIKSYSLKYYADNGYNPVPLYAIPEGYALVPVEPTDAMLESVADAMACTAQSWTKWMENAAEAYNSIIADAKFPKGSVVDEEV